MSDTQQTKEQAIGLDIELCDLGLALTKGKARKQFAAHRKACFAEIKRMNQADGLDKMTDDELMAELAGMTE